MCHLQTGCGRNRNPCSRVGTRSKADDDRIRAAILIQASAQVLEKQSGMLSIVRKIAME